MEDCRADGEEAAYWNCAVSSVAFVIARLMFLYYSGMSDQLEQISTR